MDYDVSEERIRERAYHLWEQDGSPEGKADEYWDKALKQIEAEGGDEPGDAGVSADQSSKRSFEGEVPQEESAAPAQVDSPRAKRAR